MDGLIRGRDARRAAAWSVVAASSSSTKVTTLTWGNNNLNRNLIRRFLQMKASLRLRWPMNGRLVCRPAAEAQQ